MGRSDQYQVPVQFLIVIFDTTLGIAIHRAFNKKKKLNSLCLFNPEKGFLLRDRSIADGFLPRFGSGAYGYRSRSCSPQKAAKETPRDTRLTGERESLYVR